MMTTSKSIDRGDRFLADVQPEFTEGWLTEKTEFACPVLTNIRASLAVRFRVRSASDPDETPHE
jgi:hypothetical protein